MFRAMLSLVALVGSLSFQKLNLQKEHFCFVKGAFHFDLNLSTPRIEKYHNLHTVQNKIDFVRKKRFISANIKESS